MDRHLRHLERSGSSPTELLRALLRGGRSPADAWREAAPHARPDQLAPLALELPDYAADPQRPGTLLHPPTGLRFLPVPGGAFLQGSADHEADRFPDEAPTRTVHLAPFLLAQTPCTWSAWRRGGELSPAPPQTPGSDDQPAEGIPWKQAHDFCHRWSWCLPSESQWEYACRAGTSTAYSFGDDWHEITEHGWVRHQARMQARAVAQLAPNPWGFYDMHGLTWEWCEDDWHDSYDGAPTDGSPWIDDERDERRVQRGGSRVNSPRLARSACRDFGRLERPSAQGFRPVFPPHD